MHDLDLFVYPKSRLQNTDVDLASSLRSLVEKEIMDKRLELKEDYDSLLKPSLRRIMSDIGLQKMFWPEKLGGDEYNQPAASYTVAAALEQVGRADVGLAFLAAHSFALQAALATEGKLREEACAWLAPSFCEGDRPVVVSFVLPACGEEEGVPEWRGKQLQVRAESGPDGWTLDGRAVRPSCSGGDADLFGVWCWVKGEEEPAFIVVPGDAPGLKRGPEIKKTGLAASRQAELDFSGVKVPAVNCVWRGDEGCQELLSWLYLGAAAAGVGSMLASYEILKEWGDNRVIKGRGQVFKENPVTAAVMGEVAMEISLARLLTYDLAEILAEPGTHGGAGTEGVLVNATMIAQGVYAAAERVTNRTMEMMAAAGYAKESQLERYWRDVKTVQGCLGAAELAKHQYARWFYQCETL